MPWKVTTDRKEAPASSGAFLYEIRIWPHQSLTGTGFVWVIGIMFSLALMPLFALLGTKALWGILPFAMGSIGALWWSIHRNWHDRDIVETFTLTPERAHLDRLEASGKRLEWEANPYWVRVKRHPMVGKVEDYLTLQGGPREVEIGAFLTPPERRALEDRLVAALHRVR